MKLFTNDLLIDPGRMVEQTDYGIIIPTKMRAPLRIGKVVGDGSGEVEKGSFVIYYMETASDLDGMHRKAVSINDRLHILMNEALIDGVIINKLEEVEQVWKGNKLGLKLDYSKDVRPLASKVFLELIPRKEATASGIFLPNPIDGLDPPTAKVLALGPDAMRYFKDKDEIQVGDIVRLNRRLSGGLVGWNDGDKDVYRCNGEEIVAKIDSETGKWVPVGGMVIGEMYLGKMKVVEQEGVTFLKHEERNVVIPVTARLSILNSTIIAVGGGAVEYNLYNGSCKGGDELEPGQIVVHSKFIGEDGNPRSIVGEIYLDEDQKVPYSLFPAYLIEGVMDADEEANVTHIAPGENVWSPSDFGL